MKNYFITDVETRSKVDLTEVGSRNYFNHPSTDVMYIGFKTRDMKDVSIHINILSNGEIDYGELDRTLIKYVGLPIIAHNFKFEFYAFSLLIRRGVLTGKVAEWFRNIENYRCTKATAQRFGFGRSSLHDLSVQLNVKNKKLNSGGGYLIGKYSIPDKNGEFLNVTPEDNARWVEYLTYDILATEEVYSILPKLHEDKHEFSVFQFDKILNQRGIRTDQKNVKTILKVYNKLIEETTKKAEKFGFEKSGKLTVSSAIGLKRLFNETYEIKLGDVQEKTLNKVYSSTKNKQIKELIEVRRIIQAKAPKKLFQFLYLVDAGGVYYDILNYYGTQPTGRWAGYGIQAHNLPRIVTKDFDADLKKLLAGENIDIGSMLRGLLIPRKGHKFLVGDFSSIELIVLAWVVGCFRILDNAKNGIKEYIVFGKKIYGRDINKGSLEYDTSKTAVLNLGYGGGNKPPTFTFRNILEKNGIFGTPDIQIDYIINLYRNTYIEVPEFWRKIEIICKDSILNKNQVKIYRIPNSNQQIKFLFKGRALRVFLPSGRTLYYFNPKLKPNAYGVEIELAGQKIWGGVLTAHIVSSLARDILIQAVLKCESTGLRPVLTVHDEIVNEIPTKDLKDAEKKFREIMTFVPAWCEGLPLSADIGIMNRYGKL